MLKHDINSVCFFAFDQLEQFSGLIHGISCRSFLSEQADELNFDSRWPETAMASRGAFCEALELDMRRLNRGSQCHGNRVGIAHRDGEIHEQTDGLCTDVPGLPLMLLGADCPLIIVFDPQTLALGLAHAGWRGTVNRIAGELVRTMSREFGARPGDMVAGIAPGICQQCYEVGPEVVAEVEQALPYAQETLVSSHPPRGAKPHPTGLLDLAQANRLELMGVGVPNEQIELSGLCTYERTDWFYSHRREGAQTGRHALLAALI